MRFLEKLNLFQKNLPREFEQQLFGFFAETGIDERLAVGNGSACNWIIALTREQSKQLQTYSSKFAHLIQQKKKLHFNTRIQYPKISLLIEVTKLFMRIESYEILPEKNKNARKKQLNIISWCNQH